MTKQIEFTPHLRNKTSVETPKKTMSIDRIDVIIQAIAQINSGKKLQ